MPAWMDWQTLLLLGSALLLVTRITAFTRVRDAAEYMAIDNYAGAEIGFVGITLLLLLVKAPATVALTRAMRNTSAWYS